METGIELIAKERQEQIEKHGYNSEWVKNHPGYYESEEFKQAAMYAMNPNIIYWPKSWPAEDRIKIKRKYEIERLVIAGALIAAEIDRLQNS